MVAGKGPMSQAQAHQRPENLITWGLDKELEPFCSKSPKPNTANGPRSDPFPFTPWPLIGPQRGVVLVAGQMLASLVWVLERWACERLRSHSLCSELLMWDAGDKVGARDPGQGAGSGQPHELSPMPCPLMAWFCVPPVQGNQGLGQEGHPSPQGVLTHPSGWKKGRIQRPWTSPEHPYCCPSCPSPFPGAEGAWEGSG